MRLGIKQFGRKIRMKKKWIGRSHPYIPVRAAARRRKSGRYMRFALWVASLLFVFVCYQNMSESDEAPAMEQIWAYLKEEAAVGSWKNCMMAMVAEQQEESPSAVNYLLGKLEQFYPVCGFSETLPEYDTQVESDLEAGLLAENAKGQGAGKAEGEAKQGRKAQGPKGQKAPRGRTGKPHRRKKQHRRKAAGARAKRRRKKAKRDRGMAGRKLRRQQGRP